MRNNIAAIVLTALVACRGSAHVDSDQAPLQPCDECPATVDAAIVMSRGHAEHYACDDFLGGRVSTCGTFTLVSWSGGYSGATYYFDSHGLIGISTMSDVPTTPSKYGVIPTCSPWVLKEKLCRPSDGGARP